MSSSRPSGSRKIWCAGAVGEAHHLVLDGRAVARADAADLAGVHRRAGEVGADDGVGRLGGRGDPAVDLRVGDPLGQERERHRRVVAGLHLQARPVDRAAVEARRRAGLEPAEPQTRAPAGARERPLAGGSPWRPAGVFSSPRWIRPRRKVPVVSTTAPARIARPSAGDDARPRAPFSTIRSSTAALDHLEVRRRPDRGLHGRAVELAVGLGARALHGRPLGAVEQAELDAGRVGHPPHQAVQRIDLAHQVALAEPADGRVAGHLADGGEAVRDQRRARAHARRRRRGLAAGMAAADHDDVEGFVAHGTLKLHPASGRNLNEASATHQVCFT